MLGRFTCLALFGADFFAAARWDVDLDEPFLGLASATPCLAPAIQFSIRMFIVGVALPLAAWEIATAEFDRSNVKIRSLESWATYFLLIVSWALFFIAAWRLPTLIIYGLRT